MIQGKNERPLSAGNDDGPGQKIVTINMNSPFFIFCCVHSNSLKMSKVGEFS